MKTHARATLVFSLLTSALFLSGCDDSGDKQPHGQAPQVAVYVVNQAPLSVTTELPGRTSAFRIEEVRPQVSGIILKRNFTEGGDIQAGESLYQIDPATYQAAWESAKADEAKAEAAATIAHLTVKRYLPLLGTQYVSHQDYDQAVANARQADASVLAAKATVESTRIDLAYTKVSSPISGRIGKSAVTEGALVTNGQAQALAIIMMMAGALAILQLPVAQYPTIAPPAVAISATYPGADAQTVQDTVTQVIEQNMNGIDNLMYMSSTSDSAGGVTITLTFQSGTDPDIAQVQAQNKLQLASPLLPQEVQQQGISVKKSSSSYLLVAGFVTDNKAMTQDDISDYVASNVKDTLSRLNGVGDTQLFGAQYAMRIWLNNTLLNKYQLTPVDVINQLKVQNNQIAAGQLGGVPSLPNQQLNASIIAQTRLKDPQGFGNITLRVNQDGSRVRLQDVARIEPGGENYNMMTRINGQLATGANALDTAEAIKTKLAELQAFFPAGMKVVYPYDTTPFVKISIHEVVKTLFEAIVLVFLVMYLFLQSLRATLIPTIAVPVVLLGTFAVLAAFGYSINTLTMFGMVLAIGLLVDDAIVVVENVERVMAEDKLPPKEATEKSMEQIQGALLAASLRGMNNDVYFQVGLLTTIGLSAKNAILIVEFAKDLMEKEGKGLIEATLEASRMRLRPILMTSLAFILGVMPLVISNGAGSGAQNAVGTGVMGGMLTATLLAIFLVPVFFVVVRRRFSGSKE